MLRDRCPRCGSGVVFHRRDMGRLDRAVTDFLTGCHWCGYELGRSVPEPIVVYDKTASDWHEGLCRQLADPRLHESLKLDTFNVMRQLAMLLTSRYSTVNLHAHVCDQIGIPEMNLTKGRIPFESRSVGERHHLIQLIAWLMVDLEPRLRSAWRSKAVRYNHLLKDFDDAPGWFLDVVEQFSDWRLR
jgi:hypothetical protein